MRLIFILLFVWSVSVFADPADRLYELLAKSDSLNANFEQNQFTETGELIETSHGNVSIAKPDQLRWHVLSPFEQLIVTNGIWLWQYDVELEQAVRRPHPKNAATSPLMVFVEPLSRLREVYKVEQQSDRCYVLEAHDDKSMFTRMTLCFDTADNLADMSLVDGFGQKTEVFLQQLKTNFIPSPETFEFVPPENIEVVIEEGYVPGI